MLLPYELHLTIFNSCMNDQQNSVERLTLILDATLEGWWEWNIIENTSYHSPRWYEMLGYKPNELPPTFNVWKELMHPEDQERVIALQSQYMQNSDRWELEFRMRCKNGDYKWILSRGRAIGRNAKGEATKIVGIHLDITERKKTEALQEDYRRKEELLKGIIKVSPATFKIYDILQKKMVFSSHKGGKFLGYSPEEFETFSKDFVELLVHPEDTHRVYEGYEKLLHSSGNEMVECFFRLKKKDGHYIWVKTTDWVSKRAADGSVEEIIGSTQDVTRYKELDEKLMQSIKVLENVSYKNSHLVRGPVTTILGLTALIKQDMATAGIDPILISHLERTVIKLDEVIKEFNNSLTNQLGDIS